MNWDQRYNRTEYVYGTEPNAFLVESAQILPQGKILCLAEGEGRNAVYLAGLGFDVTAVDASAVGLGKASVLAKERDVSIRTVMADLATFNIGTDEWEGIVACYCHLQPALRRQVHRAVVAGLKPGGILILEGFAKEQLTYVTGGPPDREMLFSLDELKSEFSGLEFIHAVTLEREVREGIGHTGLAAVVQMIGRKPFYHRQNKP